MLPLRLLALFCATVGVALVNLPHYDGVVVAVYDANFVAMVRGANEPARLTFPASRVELFEDGALGALLFAKGFDRPLARATAIRAFYNKSGMVLQPDELTDLGDFREEDGGALRVVVFATTKVDVAERPSNRAKWKRFHRFEWRSREGAMGEESCARAIF